MRNSGFTFYVGLVSMLLFTPSCTPPGVNRSASPRLEAESIDPIRQENVDRYLCSIEQKEAQTLIRVLDLKNAGVRSLSLPGKIHHLSGVQSEQKLYIHASNGQDEALYEMLLDSNQIRRILSFAQIGLKPSGIIIRSNKLYVSGVQNNRSALLSYDLKAAGWQPIAYDFQPGLLQIGNQIQDLQVLHFGRETLTRTLVNLINRQTQSFNYAFSFKTRLDDYLYSGVISRNGRYIFASVNDKIERYQLEGKQIQRLTPIALTATRPRHLALSQNGQQLYISHQQENRVTRLSFQHDINSWRTEEIGFPGHHEQLAVF